MTTINPDITYRFKVTDITIPRYTITQQILEWIKNNLEQLKDSQDQTIFGKVNYGYNENTLKTFGSKPVADIYINSVGYSENFDYHNPKELHSILIVYLKGVNNHSYFKACELHDYIMQEFIESDDFTYLEGIVRNSYITNSEVMNNPGNKKWGVMCACEITHLLY